MKKFKYTRTLEMTPRGNNKYFTTYYKMNPQQYTALKDFVKGFREEIDEDIALYNNRDDWTVPLPEFKRTGKASNYSRLDIVNDLNNQLQADKDCTKAMLGRWNKLFDNSPYDVILIQGE